MRMNSSTGYGAWLPGSSITRRIRASGLSRPKDQRFGSTGSNLLRRRACGFTGNVEVPFLPARLLDRRIGSDVEVGRYIKYPHSCYSFEHFERMVMNSCGVQGVAGTLQRLLSNLGVRFFPLGKNFTASTIQSIALYGAPIWAKCLSAPSRCRA